MYHLEFLAVHVFYCYFLILIVCIGMEIKIDMISDAYDRCQVPNLSS